MSKERKRLVLLDTHAILHRAYHALPDFVSPQGEPTGALYGLITFLLSITKQLNPDYIIACYDLPDPTHRHEVYDEYKAGRPKTDEALILQIQRSKELLDAFSIPHYEYSGFEADDLLATIVKRFEENNDIEIIIASGDMDTLQLVSGNKVSVYTLKRGIKDTILYDEALVKERFGFEPSLLPDYKGLRGDPSDNIPGVKGIGEKTATIILDIAKGGLDELYLQLEKDDSGIEDRLIDAGLTKRVIELLKNNQEEALFSKMLATVRNDAPIHTELPRTPWREQLSHKNIISFLNMFGFKSLISRSDDVFFSSTSSSLFGEQNTISENSEVFETKDTSLLNKKDSISDEEMKELLVMTWVLNSDITNPSLNNTIDLVREYSSTSSLTYTELKKTLEEVIANQGLSTLWNEIEKPLISVIDSMNARGVVFDTVKCKEISKKYNKELTEITNSIYKLSGKEFNISSPKQLRHIIFDVLGLKGKNKKTKTGLRSTAEKELITLKDEHPIIDHILEYREVTKLLTTYVDVLTKLVDSDGRLRSTFVQTGTTTGRLSSVSPNLQNIPIRSERGAPLRDLFICEKNNMLLALDYSQIELRIAAMLSKDEKLLDTFRNGEDIHARVASEMFSVPQSDITKSQRSAAKVLNFGILYGMGVNAIKDNLGAGTTREDAGLFLQKYQESFPSLMKYIEDTKNSARKYGYTTTYFGRRRYFPLINSKLPGLRAQAERMAVNAPIQGTQADIIKRAMIIIHNYLKDHDLNSSNTGIVMQIHDELVIELPKDSIETHAKQIKKIMESVIPYSESGILFSAEAKIGRSWRDMELL